MGYSRMTTLADPQFTHTNLSTAEVAAVVAKLRMQGFKVQALEAGFSAEVDGLQIFRATMMGNERFHARFDQRVWPDV